MLLRALVAMLLLGLVTACSIYDYTAGIPLPVSYDELRVGRTTKADALRIVGAPRAVRRQTDGDLLLYGRQHDYSTRLLIIPYLPLYDRTRGHIWNDRLALFFDDDGILQGVGVDRQIPPDEGD